MARFRTGGSGPDDRGLGWIAGIAEHRFDKAGEIYETNDPDEIEALRRCSYAEEIIDGIPLQACERGNFPGRSERMCLRDGLERKKMRELIRIGHGLYRVGMTKIELIDRIIAENVPGCGKL